MTFKDSELYTLVAWPEIQYLMSLEGFNENCHLVEQSDYIESSTYACNINWINNINKDGN